MDKKSFRKLRRKIASGTSTSKAHLYEPASLNLSQIERLQPEILIQFRTKINRDIRWYNSSIFSFHNLTNYRQVTGVKPLWFINNIYHLKQRTFYSQRYFETIIRELKRRQKVLRNIKNCASKDDSK